MCAVVGLVAPTAAYGQVSPVPLQGARWRIELEEEPTRPYQVLPADRALWAQVEGPADLRVVLLNLRGPGARGASTVKISFGRNRLRSVRVPCRASKQKIRHQPGASADIKPCRQVRVVLPIPAGTHRLAFRLVSSPLGVGLRLEKAPPRTALPDDEDLEELELVAIAPGGPLSDEGLDVGAEESEAPAAGGAHGGDGEGLVASAQPGTSPLTLEEGPPSPWAAALSRPWPWIAVGVGVAALAGATYYGIKSEDHFRRAGAPGITQRAWDRQNRKGREHAIGANLLFGLAAAGLGTAGVLVWLDVADGAADPEPIAAGQGAGPSWQVAVSVPF